MTGISVLILTYNEEKNLPMCLDSLTWCDDIIVLDSYSSDSTEEIARKRGARFYVRKFDDFARQRNYGLHQIEYRHKWVLMVDADEVVPDELLEEIREVISSTSERYVMFRMRRKDFFMGKWMKRANAYPIWLGRLVKPEYVEVKRSVNEEYEARGKIGNIKGHLLHYSYNAGFHDWFQEQNLHSTMEANRLFAGLDAGRWNITNILSKDPPTRRRAIKHFGLKMPLRPIIMFFYLYFFKCGFLEGRAAFSHCLLRSIYEYMIDLKVKELRRREKGLTI
jgi:glycosyltransferase involved in cell wall biosynthesis